MTWTGLSGWTYRFWLYPIGTRFGPTGSNYIYVKRRPGTPYWDPVYIGETENMANRHISTHHQRNAIMANGATHIFVHVNNDERARLDEETDLRHAWPTPCNRQ